MAQEDSTTVPPKGLGSLHISDFWKGAFITVGGIVLSGLYALVTQDHFPTWPEFRPYLQSAAGAFIMYIGKNLATNNVGQMFKPDKPVVKVDVETLNDLKDKAEQATQNVSN